MLFYLKYKSTAHTKEHEQIANNVIYCQLQSSGCMAKILIETYGCTLNQADSRIMAGILRSKGNSVDLGNYGDKEAQRSNSGYDYVIVNTCTVKTPTEQKILSKLSTMRNLGSRLIVAGCLASASPEKVEKVVPNANIINTTSIANIAEVIESAEKGIRTVDKTYHRLDKLAFYNGGFGTVAKIPISEGCLSNCTFCETKFARGPLNSFSEELIIRAVENEVRNGAKEIELTAQDTGAYGLDKRTNIAELVGKVAEIEGEFMIRIGMLNPEHLHRYFDELIEAYGNSKVYKFVHLPVQSGSNKVLREMRRNYTIEEFEEYVKELRNKIKGISLETDMIVGYPTESNADFEESIKMLNRVKPEITNVSKFGARPHAEASMLAQLPNSEIKTRSIEMSRVVRRIQYEIRSGFVGTKQRVIVTERHEGYVQGRTNSYLAVVLNNTGIPVGSFITSKITGNTSTCLIGEEIKEEIEASGQAESKVSTA